MQYLLYLLNQFFQKLKHIFEWKMDKDFLTWKFDISTFRLLGRELITDRITALLELVKNSFDANSEVVIVEFYDVEKISDRSKIVIRDNGVGMSFDDVKNNWMVIGTNNKRKKNITDEPFNRRVLGEKGIGRFAVDKLGAEVLLKTKKKESDSILNVKINWHQYENMSLVKDTEEKDNSKNKKEGENKFFTEMKNHFFFDKTSDFENGTELVITCLHDAWSVDDLKWANREFSKIVSPFADLKTSFKIKIFSNEFKNTFNYKDVQNEALKHASIEKQIDYDKTRGKQESLYFEKKTNTLRIIEVEKPVFGFVKFRIYYFDVNAKAIYKRFYKGGEDFIDGIKVYRDGIITTPFTQYRNERVEHKDILGVDKRRWSGFWDKISSQDVIGILEITKNENPNITEATNRQDFIDNFEYRELKDFVISQLKAVEDYLKNKKEKNKDKSTNKLIDAQKETRKFIKELKHLSNNKPELNNVIKPLIKSANDIKKNINLGIQKNKSIEKEKEKQEELFFSLMSLQEYAYDISHIVRTKIADILHYAEFIKDEFPNPEYESLFNQYSGSIYKTMLDLKKAVDFMLSYTKSSLNFEIINLKNLLNNLFYSIYHYKFKKEKIEIELNIDEVININHNKTIFEDIFINLIDNSIKALKDNNIKKIRCTSIIEKSNFIVLFSDNGCGIPAESKSKIFEIFYTTTAEEGGAGVGLFAVKKRIESLKGNIKVIDSEFGRKGATFKITIPFKIKYNK